MAVVKQRKMRLELDRNQLWKETVVQICYDNPGKRDPGYDFAEKNGRFFVNLPQVVADSIGQPEVRAKTQDEAFTAFEEALKKFKSMKTEVNKVICYEVNVSPHPTNEEWNRYHSTMGYKVAICAAVYLETCTIAGNDERRYSYELQESSLNYPKHREFRPGSYHGERCKNQVPWTKQNEAFFNWIGDRMDDLVRALAEFAEPEKLIETINAGRLLPLGAPETREKQVVTEGKE